MGNSQILCHFTLHLSTETKNKCEHNNLSVTAISKNVHKGVIAEGKETPYSEDTDNPV